MNSLVDAVKATGGIGVVGVFVPQDPGADDKLARRARSPSTSASSGSRARNGHRPGNVKAYNRRLRDLIHQGKANPSIVSHELPLERPPTPTSTSTTATTAGRR